MQASSVDILQLVLIGTTGMFLLVLAIFLFVLLYQKKLTKQQVELRKLEEDYQKELLSASIQTQEKERKRFAKDLHDDVGAMLSVMKINLSRIQRKLDQDTMPFQVVTETSEMADTMIEHLRAIARGLLPVTLEKFGIIHAIEQLCNQLNDPAGTKVYFQLKGVLQQLDEDTALSIYRITQELLNNAIKHAGASFVEVSLELMPHQLRLMVVDDGKGMNWQSQKENAMGLGLKNVESWLKVLAGHIEVISSDGGGTKIAIEIPLVKVIK